MSSNPERPEPTTRILRVGHRDILLNETGKGPPLLLLHGGGPGASGLSNYVRNIPALARDFRLLIPDMPGYGGSTKGLDRRDPFGDLADAMRKLLAALDIERAHIVGNSLGGACALRLALDAPQTVDRLVLMGPGGINTTRSLPTPGLKRLLDYYGGTGPSREKLRRFIQGDLVYDARDIPDAVIEQRFAASIDPEVVANPPLRRPKGWPSFRNLDFTRDPRLSAMAAPTLVLWGREDRVNRPSGAHTLQQCLPNCDVYLFSRTGHWVQWERADIFDAVVRAFLLDARGGGTP